MCQSHSHRTNIVAARARPNRCLFAKQYQSPVVFVFSLLRHCLPLSDLPMETIFFIIFVFIRFHSFARCKTIIKSWLVGMGWKSSDNNKKKNTNERKTYYHNIVRAFNTDSGDLISGYLFVSRIDTRPNRSSHILLFLWVFYHRFNSDLRYSCL